MGRFLKALCNDNSTSLSIHTIEESMDKELEDWQPIVTTKQPPGQIL